MSSPFLQYLDERFPVGSYFVLIAAMVAGSSSAVASAVHRAVRLTYEQVVVTVILLLGFFVLRVFDEHKDYEKDTLAHPERLLSRGVITLRGLRLAGLIAIAVQLCLAVWIGYGAVFWVLVYLAFSVAMRFEFGLSSWLNRHIVVYALTHNPVVGLMIWVSIVVAAQGGVALSPALVSWLCVTTTTSLGFEVGRKMRAPGDELRGQDTYTAALGVTRASLLLLGCEVLAVVSAMPLLRSSAGSGVLLGVGAFMLLGPALFMNTPSRRHAKFVETTSTVGALLTYLTVTIDACTTWGIAWS